MWSESLSQSGYEYCRDWREEETFTKIACRTIENVFLASESRDGNLRETKTRILKRNKIETPFVEKPFISANKYSMNTLYLGSTHYYIISMQYSPPSFGYWEYTIPLLFFLIIGTLTNKRKLRMVRRESNGYREVEPKRGLGRK